MRIKVAVALTLLGVAVLAPMTASAANQAVRVPLDVEVYGTPADDSTKRSEDLPGGSEVLLLKQRADHWCNVASGKDPVPGGKGWIWCGPGADNEDYSVQPVVAEAPAGGGEPAGGGTGEAGAGGTGTGEAEATQAPTIFQCVANVAPANAPAAKIAVPLTYPATDMKAAEGLYPTKLPTGLVLPPGTAATCTQVN